MPKQLVFDAPTVAPEAPANPVFLLNYISNRALWPQERAALMQIGVDPQTKLQVLHSVPHSGDRFLDLLGCLVTQDQGVNIMGELSRAQLLWLAGGINSVWYFEHHDKPRGDGTYGVKAIISFTRDRVRSLWSNTDPESDTGETYEWNDPRGHIYDVMKL